MKPLSFSKETTLILKGIAILMMIFLHLFNRAEYYSLCESFIHIDGIPLVYFIARACNPVGFFCFLSGYGVYYSYRKREGKVMESIIGGGKKSIKLYVSLWVLFLVFVPICSLVKPDVYPGDMNTVMTNILAYTNTWNHTVWFVLPFVMVMMTYGLWMKFLKSKKGMVVVGLLFLILYYAVAVLYGRKMEYIFSHRYILHCCRFVELLTPFTFGAIAQRLSNVELPAWLKPSYLHISCVVLAVAMFAYSAACGMPLYPIYCALFMIVLANIRYGGLLSNILRVFGKYSMIIWLTHVYYFEVLFRNQIFQLKYPLFVFIAVTIISLVAAMLLDRVITPITKRIK